MGVLYRPPNSVFKDFIGELERVIKLLPKNLTFLMGDFNINLFKFASDTEVQSFENFFLSEGLHPSISLATHKRSSQEGTCIDNILCNQIEVIQHSGVISDQGSSHSPIFLYPTSTLTYLVTQKSNIHSIIASLRKILIGCLRFFK